MSKRIYILDAGHGGIDPSTKKYVTAGKRSPKWSDGSIYYEGVGNREIVKLVAEGLDDLNIDYDFTVKPNDYTDLGLTSRARVADKKIKESGKKGLLISVHSNAASVEAANGYEIFTSKGQTSSDTFADIMFLEFRSEFSELKARTDGRDGDYDKEEDFTILVSSKCPAILIESMFHSNEKECRILMSPEGKKRIAKAIIKAIVKMESI